MRIMTVSAFVLGFYILGNHPVRSADNFKEIQLSPIGSIQTPILPPAPASETQRSLYQSKIERIRSHHLNLPTQPSFAAFSDRVSANKLIIRPRPQAAQFDSILLFNKIPATENAKMDYGYVSPIAEPSSAQVRNNILVTFNWGAIWSSNAGQTFNRIDPYAAFETPPASMGKGFCCDQVTLYIETHDLLIWLLQGAQDERGNTVRLLIAKGNDIDERRWQVHDFTPTSVGNWEGEWFDFPDVAITRGYLFISLNTFRDGWIRSVILRFPLDQLAAYGSVQAGVFSSDSREDFAPRFTQGARDTMYWATQRSEDSIIVRSWRDDASQPQRRRLVQVERYTSPNEKTVGSSTDAKGNPWLHRLDERITAGWIAQNTVGFAWSSGAIPASPGGAAYPFVHIRAAILKQEEFDKDASSVIIPTAQPHIWSDFFSLAYPTAYPNADGDIGFGLFYAGPKHFPSSAIGVLRRTFDDWKIALTVLAEGKTSPPLRRCPEDWETTWCGYWGDYITIRPDPVEKTGWYIASFTAEEAKPGEPWKQKNVVTFSRFHIADEWVLLGCRSVQSNALDHDVIAVEGRSAGYTAIRLVAKEVDIAVSAVDIFYTSGARDRFVAQSILRIGTQTSVLEFRPSERFIRRIDLTYRTSGLQRGTLCVEGRRLRA